MSLSIFCCVCSGAAFRHVTASARYSAPVFAAAVLGFAIYAPVAPSPRICKSLLTISRFPDNLLDEGTLSTELNSVFCEGMPPVASTDVRPVGLGVTSLF